jgi:RimJ/RimL family protein N-acetyltransferase
VPLSLPLSLAGCAIRSFRDSDVDDLAVAANSRAVWRNLRDRFPHPYTRLDAEAWLAHAAAARPETHFAVAVDDRVAGGIGFDLGSDVHRRSAEIGYWIAEPHWGRGLATASLRALSTWAMENFDLVRLQAGVFAWNPASARVLEKAGYTLEGRLRLSVTKDGQTIDQLLYALLRE